MPKFTIINTSGNIPGEDADFIVHAAGCRDIKRTMQKSMGVSSYDVDAESAEAAVEAEVREFTECEMGYTPDHFRIMPCCSRCSDKKENRHV